LKVDNAVLEIRMHHPFGLNLVHNPDSTPASNWSISDYFLNPKILPLWRKY